MGIKSLEIDQTICLHYLGPDVDQGPLPALFYFSLSSQESLLQDPFNQPALYLSGLPLRVFSMTLPGHGKNLPSTQAMAFWAQEILSGHNLIHPFLLQIEKSIKTLIDRKILLSDQIGAMGLSRGAFIALHAAARIPLFQTIVGFAPLTKLLAIKEFKNISPPPLAEELDLIHLHGLLYNKTIRFYIGNLDVRVGTSHVFHLVEKLSKTASEHKIRSPKIELIITPSIGHQGHGTSKEVFQQGAHWIAKELGALHVL
ncbi:MAG: prolyl oligopeptidase family serine peptidase [Chlamydiales bacterium]|nr:prolyl oligopeptidase family serine peptidase [Chlamydiales bacterium]